MKMADDLLACEKRIVTDVVDRDLNADRCPDTIGESQLACHAPALGLESRDGLAEQRLLGRVDDPGTIAIVGDAEILPIVIVGHRASNALGTWVASDDANGLTTWIQDRLNCAGIV
jgi:hypothetical protein